jgi:hypothetical protein
MPHSAQAIKIQPCCPHDGSSMSARSPTFCCPVLSCCFPAAAQGNRNATSCFPAATAAIAAAAPSAAAAATAAAPPRRCKRQHRRRRCQCPILLQQSKRSQQQAAAPPWPLWPAWLWAQGWRACSLRQRWRGTFGTDAAWLRPNQGASSRVASRLQLHLLHRRRTPAPPALAAPTALAQRQLGRLEGGM